MAWWDFDRWEKEIDFMAMNGINMPLAVIGSEAVLYETLLEFGFTKQEALRCITGPAFWAWQLMTNIIGYLPPEDEGYIYRRLELGRKILARYLQFGMHPIQQGFSGHVPPLLKEKYPDAAILPQSSWCNFPPTALIDPLDPLFLQFGRTYLNKLKRLMGCHHFLACDPFHEGTPPKETPEYLHDVGATIDRLYRTFDKHSVWVMQAWSLRKDIVLAVEKERLLILDLNSARTPDSENLWGYPVVAGMLHNFGGKNAMQGKLYTHSKNVYCQLKNGGANVVGSGLFMEGIEQNPVVYELQFDLLTTDQPVDLDQWLKDYISRRYGKADRRLHHAWEGLLKTCYQSEGYSENGVGSPIASRPQMIPVFAGPCCQAKPFYDTALFEQAVKLFLSVADDFYHSDGYQFDLCDMVRQVLSNRFYQNQVDFAAAYQKKDLSRAEIIAKQQEKLLRDMDALTSCRSELTLAMRIRDAHRLAADEREKRYFDLNARALVTLWGDIDGSTNTNCDYSWREWSGLIKEYYLPRWQMFFDDALHSLRTNTPLDAVSIEHYWERDIYLEAPFGKRLASFEQSWVRTCKDYPAPTDCDCIPLATQLLSEMDNLY